MSTLYSLTRSHTLTYRNAQGGVLHQTYSRGPAHDEKVDLIGFKDL